MPDVNEASTFSFRANSSHEFSSTGIQKSINENQFNPDTRLSIRRPSDADGSSKNNPRKLIENWTERPRSRKKAGPFARAKIKRKIFIRKNSAVRPIRSVFTLMMDMARKWMFYVDFHRSSTSILCLPKHRFWCRIWGVEWRRSLGVVEESDSNSFAWCLC